MLYQALEKLYEDRVEWRQVNSDDVLSKVHLVNDQHVQVVM